MIAFLCYLLQLSDLLSLTYPAIYQSSVSFFTHYLFGA